MAKFQVTIKETLSMTVEKEADTFDDALRAVMDEYRAEKHVLTSEHYECTDFHATEIDGKYEVYKHYRDDMVLELTTSELSVALRKCITDETLSGENGHALSVHNGKGCIFEIAYYGTKEINGDGCATTEELATIKSFVEENF